MTDTMRIKQHDLAPDLVATLTDRDGTIANLSTATVKVIGSRNGQVIFSRAPASATLLGVVTMPWSPGDTDEDGIIEVEIEVTWPGTPPRPQTFPPNGTLKVIVDRDLG